MHNLGPGLDDVDRPVVLIGYSAAWLAALTKYLPERSLVVIDEPDVVRKRDVHAAAASSAMVRDVIEWEYQLDGMADACYLRHRDPRPAAVIPVVEYGVPFAARLAERYGVPGAGYGAATVLRDKRLQRVVTAAAGVANPRSVEVAGPAEVRAFLAEVGGPVVLKPADRQAAVGIGIVSDPAEVDAAWAECAHQDEGDMTADRPWPLRMLAEQFVAGDEYSVELMVAGGRPVFSGVTRKFRFPGRYPVEQGHLHPADIDAELTARLLAATELVVDAAGMDCGFVHCEWIVAGGEPHLVECAGRLPGGWVMDLVELAWDHDVFGQYLTLLVTGRLAVPPPPAATGHAAIWMAAAAAAGTVDGVDGVAAARAIPGVRHVIVADAGDEVRELRSSWDRTVGVVASGATAPDALAAARRAVGRIAISVRPAVPADVGSGLDAPVERL